MSEPKCYTGCDGCHALAEAHAAALEEVTRLRIRVAWLTEALKGADETLAVELAAFWDLASDLRVSLGTAEYCLTTDARQGQKGS